MSSEAYHGNRHLKKTDVAIQFSQKEVKEFVKCSKDPIYFIENYVKIVNVDKGLVNFKPYEYQKRIIEASVAERFVICKMPRQCGKTTAIVGLMLWYALFNEDYSIAILAHKLSQAQEIMSRIQLAYESLPKWLQQGIVEWNKRNVELENGSKILASSTTASGARGGSFNLVYLDEFAFVPNNIQEKFFSSTYPVISSGQTTKVLITSTPNGLNLFYKLWRESELGRNDYKRISIHWSDTPGRDEKWKEETIRNTSYEQFRVEFETEFVGSSSTLIHPDILRTLISETPVQMHGDIKIYHEPQRDHTYFMVVDPSRGVGKDYSVFTIFDATEVPYKVAAIYRSNDISPLLLPAIIQTAAIKYNSCYVAVETNDNGQQVADPILRNVILQQVENIKKEDLDTTLFSFEQTRGGRMSIYLTNAKDENMDKNKKFLSNVDYEVKPDQKKDFTERFVGHINAKDMARALPYTKNIELSRSNQYFSREAQYAVMNGHDDTSLFLLKGWVSPL